MIPSEKRVKLKVQEYTIQLGVLQRPGSNKAKKETNLHVEEQPLRSGLRCENKIETLIAKVYQVSFSQREITIPPPSTHFIHSM
jgi:hypothetical protein